MTNYCVLCTPRRTELETVHPVGNGAESQRASPTSWLHWFPGLANIVCVHQCNGDMSRKTWGERGGARGKADGVKKERGRRYAETAYSSCKMVCL